MRGLTEFAGRRGVTEMGGLPLNNFTVLSGAVSLNEAHNPARFMYFFV